MWRTSAGREFQTDGPATENARTPNLVTVGGTVYDDVSDDVSVEVRIKDAVYSKLQPESMRWNPNV